MGRLWLLWIVPAGMLVEIGFRVVYWRIVVLDAVTLQESGDIVYLIGVGMLSVCVG